MRELVACGFCGKSFVKCKSSSRHCSMACRSRAARASRDVLVCQHCGDEFVVEKKRTRVQVYCSSRCRGRAERAARPKKMCGYCGQEFRRGLATDRVWDAREHCSPRCKKFATGHRVVVACKRCGKPFEKSTAEKTPFCSTRCRRNLHPCRFCGQDVAGRAVYCSRTCLKEYWAATKLLIACAQCGREVPKYRGKVARKSCCSRKCRDAFRTRMSAEARLRRKLQKAS